MLPKVFVDSDVVISSLLSPAGGAAALFSLDVHHLYISTFSLKELIIVCQNLGIAKTLLDRRVEERCRVIQLKNLGSIKMRFGKFVSDQNDAHIVAGAIAAKVQFLSTKLRNPSASLFCLPENFYSTCGRGINDGGKRLAGRNGN